jgi:hypothetical protein
MTDIRHIAQEDLVLYAMHALAPEESSPVAAHLATCAQCRQEAAEAQEDMALLALSVEQQPLPAGAEERFLARIAASVQAASIPATVTLPDASSTEPRSTATASVLPFAARETQPKRSIWPVLIPWAAAAALTAVCISLGVENVRLNDAMISESALFSTLSSKAAHAQQIVDALNSPQAQRVTLTSATHPPEPTGHAIYLADRGSLLFQADHLKPLEPGKTYELWVIPASGKAPIPAGTFRPNAAGYASVVLPTLPAGVAAKAFGVTIENGQGALTPTMPIVLAGG